MAKALVLGATGHIGTHIVRALLAEGHEVRAVYRSERFLHVLEGLPVERIRVDLEQPAVLQPFLRGCDWVFHAAGYYPSGREARARAIERSIQSTRRVFDQIRDAVPRRVVFTSSAATICPAPGRLNLYSAVKIAMEHETLEAARGGLPVVVVNPTLCIGEYDARPFSGRAVLAFAKHRIPWYTQATFNVVYTGDVGVGHVHAADRGRVGEKYLLAGRNVTLLEFGACVAREVGVAPPRWCIPYSVAIAAACGAEGMAWLTRRDPLFTRDEVRRARSGTLLDGSKAVRELGMPQTPIEEAVRRAVAWFRANGML